MSSKNKGGRKAEIEGASYTITVSTKLSKKDIKDIEEIAEYLEIPKMTLIRNMILNEIEKLKSFKRWGLLYLAKKYTKGIEYREKMKEIQKRVNLGDVNIKIDDKEIKGTAEMTLKKDEELIINENGITIIKND